MRTFRANDVTVLNDHTEVPGLGFLPVNAFVLHATEPVVIDTGLGRPDRNFLADLDSVIDPTDVRWIWLTHPDRDHTGGLFELLDAAPQAKLVTTFDSPPTVGFYDHRSGACFSSDCFGAPLATEELASGADVGAAPDAEVAERQVLWASVDSPWVHNVDAEQFESTLQPLRAFNPLSIFSTHLPPASGRLDEYLATVRRAPTSSRAPAADQQALEAVLSQFEPEMV